jgi:hypothetical protein
MQTKEKKPFLWTLRVIIMDFNDGPPSKCKIVYPITELLITPKRERERERKFINILLRNCDF